MRWYAVLFWLWVIGSLVVLVWRRTNRRAAGPTRSEERPDPLSRQWAPPPRPDPDASAPPADADLPPVEPARVEPLRPEPDRAEPRAASVGPPTLAELLSGIVLPHGLVPLTQFGVPRDSATHIVLATGSATPDAVRQGLEDELVRLGFEVRQTGPTTAVAEREAGRIGVAVHPDPARVAASGTPRFPTALPGTVVVELSVE